MSRWNIYFRRALSALRRADRSRGYPWPAPGKQTRRKRKFEVDLSDRASVDAAFYSIVQREWDADGFQKETRTLERRAAHLDRYSPQPLPHYFWMWYLPW